MCMKVMTYDVSMVLVCKWQKLCLTKNLFNSLKLSNIEPFNHIHVPHIHQKHVYMYCIL